MKKNLRIHLSTRLELSKKSILLTFLTTFLLFSSIIGYGENETTSLAPSGSDTSIGQSSMQADQTDVSSIDNIVKAIYEAITLSESEKPDMDRLRDLFTPQAVLIRVTPDQVIEMDPASFILYFSERIRTGALKSFYEAEISRKTHLYGSIAQVWSTYKKGINTEDPESFGRGINSIQLYYDGIRWWISSILWEDETSDNPIPEKYLQ